MEAWYLDSELDCSKPLVALECGQRKLFQKRFEDLPNFSLTVNLYQLDVGSVFVSPDQIDLSALEDVKIPTGYDSVLGN